MALSVEQRHEFAELVQNLTFMGSDCFNLKFASSNKVLYSLVQTITIQSLGALTNIAKVSAPMLCEEIFLDNQYWGYSFIDKVIEKCDEEIGDFPQAQPIVTLKLMLVNTRAQRLDEIEFFYRKMFSW
jgi:hypothetical protein